MMLTKAIFDQIVSLLLPEMGDAEARKAIVISALHGSPVLQRIQWSGAAYSFTVQLVRLLDQFGEVAPGRPALAALMEEVKTQVGTNVQARIDEVLAELAGLKAPTDQPAARPVLLTPKPVVEGNPGVVASPSPEAQTPARAAVAVNSNPASQAGHSASRWPRKHPFRPDILVMKGGGVKGIAYVGALTVLEEYGYRFNHFVGTSAGAISAALLSVGYSSKELGTILEKTNFKEFKDGWLPLSLPLLLITKGLYRGEAFRVWLENYLRTKFPKYERGDITIEFRHLKEIDRPNRLTVFASCRGRTDYAFDSEAPEHLKRSISFACRCSMAIPYFFVPEKIDGNWVVDGGMRNNYPIDALLRRFPALRDSSDFIGLYLGHGEAKRNSRWLLLDLFSIWSEAGDEEAKREFIDRTIVIDPRPVRTTDFSLSPNDVKFLLAEGRAAALHWLHYWSDREGQLSNEVDEARRQAEELRTLVIDERWRKLRGNLVLAGLAVLVPLFIGGIWYLLQP